MDLYKTLGAVINRALEQIPEAEAFELSHLINVASTIRQQAIDANEPRLKQEAERLMYRVDQEIEDRGGEAYMEEQRKVSLEHSLNDLADLPTATIIHRLADVRLMNNSGFDNNALERYTEAAYEELRKRGVAVDLSFIELENGKVSNSNTHRVFTDKAKPKSKKIPFPEGLTPNQIINAKTPKGIPNT